MKAFALAEGVSPVVALVLAAVVGLWLSGVFVEVRQSERRARGVLATAVVAAVVLLGALLRPLRVSAHQGRVGPRVVILVDQARRMRLPAEKGDRRSVALSAARALVRRWSSAKVDVYGFASGALAPLALDHESTLGQLGEESDLSAALAELAATPGERARSIVVVSDGRLARPTEQTDEAALKLALGSFGAPVHTVRVTEAAVADASIRQVATVGAAVAHQPLVLHVTVECSGGLACDEVPVTVRELRQGSAPAELAHGIARPRAASRRSISRSRSSAPGSASWTWASSRRRATKCPRTTTGCCRSTSGANACACCTSPGARRTTCGSSACGSRPTNPSIWSRFSSCARTPTIRTWSMTWRSSR